MNKKRHSTTNNFIKSKKIVDQQVKISAFFQKTSNENNKDTNDIQIISSDKTSSPRKRKNACDYDLSDELKPGSKLRKTSQEDTKKEEASIIKSTSALMHNSKMNNDDSICQKSIDALFTDIDFSFDASFTIPSSKSCVDNKQSNCNYSKDSLKENNCSMKHSKQNNSQNDLEIIQINNQNADSDKLKKGTTNDVAQTAEHYENELSMDDLFEDDWSGKVEADLSTYKRCEILNIEYCAKETIIFIKELDSNGEGLVKCRQFWKDLKLKPSQICTLKAKKDNNQWVIDNSHGFLIIEPDTLLAGTVIVGSIFCARRSILQEIFNGLQTLPHYEPDALTMTTGTLSHEILQEVLQKKIEKLTDIKDIYNKKMKSDRVLNMLYANNLSVAEVHKHTQPYLLHIYNFVQMYIKGKTVPNAKKLDCNINSIQDIEENIWLPKLGIKGKIDVTAEVNIHAKRKIMPIEIKTGKPSFSIEHRGQVMLYIMMMKLVGKDVDSGLLLYLKENIMQEIKSSHSEIRDLIIVRNNLMYHLTNKLESLEIKDGTNEKKTEYSLNLPEPINHPSCGRCSFNTLCSIYLKKDLNKEQIELPEEHYMKKIVDEVHEYLTPDHIEYVLKWTILLQLEQIAETCNFRQSDVWTLDPETREKRGTCICNLKISDKIMKTDDTYIHVFTRHNNEDEIDFTLLEFSEDEYVIVSTNDRVNITSGKIRTIESNTVTMNLNKNILELFPNEIYHIDKYTSTSLVAFNNYGNIGGLLDNNENCGRLRNIIIDRTPATFLPRVPSSVASVASKYTATLNENQQMAVMKVLAMNDYLLIKGMPGTGKTQTLVSLIELLAKLGKSILITAHTNTAVDNILLKLFKKNIDFLRLGSSVKIHPTLHSKCELPVTANCTTPESMHAVYCSKNIVGVTCYSASHPLLSKKKYDICIVDESTQVLQPTILRPLYSASKFVLVGDPEQLPPIARSDEARKLGLNESLFQRLDTGNNVVTLRLQYRMNKRIMDVANKLTYDDKLLAANRKIANAIMEVTDFSAIALSEAWIQQILSIKLEDSAMVIDTTPTWVLNVEDYMENPIKTTDFLCNIWEIAIISRLVDVLMLAGIDVKEIGVISPYRIQVAFLKKFLHGGVEINTVDQYQGRDKQVIIYSCSKSIKATNSIKEFDLLQDHSRLTVAVTRAKHKLIIVGDKICLERFTPFKKLFQSISDQHVYTVKDGEDDFSWKDLLNAIKV